MPLKSNVDYLYIQVAEGIEKMIADDVLRIGDKLPSVRLLCDEYGISMGTAFQAYYLLEGKGLIESRPKSGYYVRHNHKRVRDLPGSRSFEPIQREVSTGEMIETVYKDITAPDVINFAVAVPALELLPVARLNKSVLHALRKHQDYCIGYEHVQGNVELRKQVAKLAFNWGGKVNYDEVIITAGCMEALVMCLRAVTKPGDTVAVEQPSYFGIYQAIESLGLKVVEITSHPETGPDLDYLEKVFKQFPIKACLVVPNFSNPIGSCMPGENKKRLVALIEKHKIPLIEDDIYGELYFGKHRPKTCKFYDTTGLVMHCSSVSKSLAPGYRIGWVIPGKFLTRVRQLKMMHTISTPTITQAAMAHFLGIGRYEYHLKQLRRALHTQCLKYTEAVTEYFPEDSKISRPLGGFVLWVELNKKVDAFKLCTEAMKHQISLAPGHIFSVNRKYTNYVRISYGRPWDDNIEYGLMMVGKLLRKMV